MKLESKYYTLTFPENAIEYHMKNVNHFVEIAKYKWSWWRHQIEKISVLLAICAGNSPVRGEFPTQRPVTRSFDVYFDLHPN